MAIPREVRTKIVDCCFDTPILLLGKVGENLATRVIIDASEWQDGNGTFQLLVKRADEEMFTATISQENGVVTWLIPAAEIGAAGYGEIELNYIVGEAKMKSARVDTRVFSSVEIDSLPPNGTTWSQMVLAAIQDARDAADDAEEDSTKAAASATLAQSYAKGGTSTRTGEDTDNAKYYKEQAAQSATTASDKATETEQAARDANSAKEAAARSAGDSSSSATLAQSYAKGGTGSRTGENEDNALYYKQQAALSAEAASRSETAAGTSARNAGLSEAAAAEANRQTQAAHDEIFDVLNNATILDTTETVTLNSDNLVSQIVHTSNETGLVVRTDVFTYTENNTVVTEVRTAADGRTQTNIYNLDTLEQQFNV